jgi:hypothetical protein
VASLWRFLFDVDSLQKDLDEVKVLTLRYLKEETLDPLKKLGPFIGWGFAGSACIGIGVILLLVGSLRFLQTFAFFRGTFAWLAYFIVIMVALLLLGATTSRVVANTERKKPV